VQYLSCSGCYSVPGINDTADWAEMNESFACVGITEAERQEIMRSLSVCLWLGNLAFCEKRHEVAEVQDRQVLDIIAGLLQVPSASLESALCNRQIQTGIGAKAERFTKPQTSSQSDFSRDTLAKAIFTKVRRWLRHCLALAITCRFRMF
jgi:myosin-1